MAAPKNNKFWELRSSHGRNLIFSSPQVLWEACKEYFETTSERVWIKKDWVGKDAYEVDRETSAPFTKQGLYIFLDIDRSTWDEYKKRKDFSPICTRVEEIIYLQKFEGAVVGAFNHSIIARELGLADKKEVSRKKIVVTTKKRISETDD
jgi:hypothetical protein